MGPQTTRIEVEFVARMLGTTGSAHSMPSAQQHQDSAVRPEPSIEQRIQHIAVATYIERGRILYPIATAYTAGVAYAAWPLKGALVVGAWAGVRMLLLAWRMALDRWIKRSAIPVPTSLLRQLDVMLALDGLTYGAVGSLLVWGQYQNALYATFMLASNLAIGGFALAQGHSYFRAYVVFLLPTLLPPTIVTAMSDYPPASLVVVCFLGAFMTYWNEGSRSEAFFRNSTRLQLESQASAQAKAEALKDSERLSALKSQFLATISHELRTPLNGILGVVQLRAMKSQSKEERDAMNVIGQSGRHLLGVINQLLDYSQLEAGGARVQIAPLELNGLIRDSVQLCQSLADTKQLRLQAFGDSESQWIEGDAARIRQVLVNLLGNACKFTQRGHVHLRWQCDGATLHVEVQDTGPGIADEMAKDLFAPFVQNEKSLGQLSEGSGLGLAISRRIARSMGGEVSLKSTGKDGTCFVFEAQVRPAQPGIALPTSELTPPHDAGLAPLHGKVLVVDNDPVGRLIAESMLQAFGLEVLQANDGIDAVAQTQLNQPDLVLMDWQMPGLDGVQATKRIREWERAKGLVARPIVLISANIEALGDLYPEGTGGNASMGKPLNIASLHALVARLLKQASADQQAR
jgi:signal transduction histidine kinase/CheY-like chemotaxis protein